MKIHLTTHMARQHIGLGDQYWPNALLPCRIAYRVQPLVILWLLINMHASTGNTYNKMYSIICDNFSC